MIADVLSGQAPWHVETGDALAVLRGLPEGRVQTCVTSPPYFGLRDYGVAGQMGLEATPALYVADMVEVFREVRRVLRGDGTLWLDIGDSYAAGGANGHSQRSTTFHGHAGAERDHKEKRPPPGTKPKDLLGVPWQLALALRDDGWYLRSEIIWCKSSPMPESVRDRPTRAHEQVFLLAKEARYFYDAESERAPRLHSGPDAGWGPRGDSARDPGARLDLPTGAPALNGRNLWSYWTDISPSPDSVGHFALMPLALAARCVRLGTSAKGACPRCGAAWRRVVERRADGRRPYATVGPGTKADGAGRADGSSRQGVHKVLREDGRGGDLAKAEVSHLGWRPGCACPDAPPVGCVVLDPFAGAGTTGIAARNSGQRFVGIELSATYADLARQRIGAAAPLLDYHDKQPTPMQGELF